MEPRNKGGKALDPRSMVRHEVGYLEETMERLVEIRHGQPVAFARGEALKPFAKIIGKSIAVGLLAGLPAAIILTVYYWI